MTGVNEDFAISLPISIVAPLESLAVIDTVLIPTSSYTCNEGNYILYIRETNSEGLPTFNRLALTKGFYTPETLATEVQFKLNNNPQKQVSALYVVEFDERTGKFKIKCSVAEK